jgi:signal transduction histidine kinase
LVPEIGSSHIGDPSHELRSPLHVIKGNLELLIRIEHGNLSIDGQRCVAEMTMAACELEVAILRLLDLLLHRPPPTAT